MASKRTPRRTAPATPQPEAAGKAGPKPAAKAKALRPATKLTASLELLLLDAMPGAAEAGVDGPATAAPVRRHAATPNLMSSGMALASIGVAKTSPVAGGVHLFVHCAADAPEVLPGGVRLYGEGTLRTALVPLDGIRALAGEPSITRVSAPRQLDYAMDVARPLVRIPQLQAQVGRGKGVIAGVVDSGIDASHPAFAGRLLAIWDQTLPGAGPGGNFVAKGRVLGPGQFGASRDTVGHGTHVAGIAAGAGAGTPFEGVAPEADMLIVKTTMANSDIGEGVRWIFARAAQLQRPAVVNLSLGGHFDGHDGRDDLSRLVDQQSGQGRIVVAAAGNEGQDAIHGRRVISAGTTVAFDVAVAPISGGLALPFFVLSGWYAGAGKCRIRLVSSGGQATPWQAVGAAASTAMLGQDRVEMATPGLTAANADRQFVVQVDSPFVGRVQGGTWRLEVRRSSGVPGTAHVWLLTGGASPLAAQLSAPAFSELIGSPGAATQAITVASFTSRNQWTSMAGSAQQVGLTQGTISSFSSPGPRRDGARKPDVAAPGAMIVSCESATWAAPLAQKQKTRVAAGWRVEAGTSMASPFIAGVVACLLRTQPNLTPQQAKAWLAARSRIPGRPPGTHDPKWGLGLLKV